MLSFVSVTFVMVSFHSQSTVTKIYIFFLSVLFLHRTPTNTGSYFKYSAVIYCRPNMCQVLYWAQGAQPHTVISTFMETMRKPSKQLIPAPCLVFEGER